jgi:hypothetical protein
LDRPSVNFDTAENLLIGVSSERWADDIGDITYVLCGKARIPFSVMEEYCADNRVSAERLGKTAARKHHETFFGRDLRVNA